MANALVGHSFSWRLCDWLCNNHCLNSNLDIFTPRPCLNLETVINKQYRLTRRLGFTGMTYLLQTFRYSCLFQCATLPQVLEFASADCIYLPLFACSCEKWYSLITMHLRIISTKCKCDGMNKLFVQIITYSSDGLN